jgi:microcystin-dependent protein
MSTPFVGEIRMFGGNFQIASWAFCNGQLLPISEYSALFTLIGTTYGGDGQNTFGLPNLQGRLPLHVGSGYALGQLAGEENHSLNTNEIPNHNHTVAAAATANAQSPSNTVYGGGGNAIYRSVAPSAPMNATMIGAGGGSLPHPNVMPFQCLTFIIALFGIFPSRT